MNTNKDMTIEEVKEIATKAGLSFEETATKEDLLTLIESKKEPEIIEEVKEETPVVEEVKEETPVVEEVKEVAPVEMVKETAPVEEVKEEVNAVEETVAIAPEDTLTSSESTDESGFTFANDESQKPKKKSKLVIIIPIIVFVFVLLITALGIVVYMNTKSYKVEKHKADENVERYYELIEEFETYKDELLSLENLGVDVENTTLEERKDKYNEIIDSLDDVTESIQTVYDYLLECERDFIITDDEIKELESMIDDLK